jgi:hypothetical protein
MIEFLKHAFGLCGENHPSLLYSLGIMPIIIGVWVKFKFLILRFISNLKNFVMNVGLFHRLSKKR